MPPKRPDPGWKVEAALASLRGRIDPYIWDQGQELFRRDAVEDFQKSADDRVINVRVVDPRDTRKFFVEVTRDQEGHVTARCPCPYRLGGYCRHQVVGLEYLRSIIEASREASAPAPSKPKPVEAQQISSVTVSRVADVPPPTVPQGPILYRLFSLAQGVATRPDGSLLRVVLFGLGSLKAPHRVGLQLFTGTGWTDVRTSDLGRWISRGTNGPHPRDQVLAAHFTAEGALLREAPSETFASLLGVLVGTESLVDRGGRVLGVSRWPWRLAATLVRGAEGGVGIELTCLGPSGESRPFNEVSIVPSAAPWIQLETGEFHPLEAAAVGSVLAELQEESLASICGSDLDRLLAQGSAEIERLCLGRLETEPGLIEEVEGVSSARIRLMGDVKKLQGKLEFCYGGRWVDAPETPEPWTVELNGKIERFPPAGQSLARARRELEAMGFTRSEGGWVLEKSGSLATMLQPRERPFVKVELPQKLEALNLSERSPVLKVKVSGGGVAAAGEGAGKGIARHGSGIAWLEVTASLVDGSRELPIDLSAIEESLKASPRSVLQLEDGSVLGLAHDSVRKLVELGELAEACGSPRGEGDAERGRFQLPLSMAGEFLAEQPSREVEFGLEIQSLIDGLRGGARLEPQELVPGLGDRLRPYQFEAVRWFGDLAAWGLAGILADEMGLGKTIMALSHFFGREKRMGADGPVLVVCPSSLVFNWIDECRRFFPKIKAEGLQGLPPALREERIRSGADMLVTSYALLRRDREALEARGLRAAVLDEAQHIKNSESQTAQAAFALRAPERWILTGTPIENHLGELWSLFHFLMPGFLGSRADFEERFATPISRREEGVIEKLRSRVRPFILRRTKSQVLKELPPRIEQVERVPMADVQRKIYETYLLAARGEFEGTNEKEARFKILAALTRLRQICCHPKLVLDEKALRDLGAEAAELTGGKFELLLELLDECIEEGHRVLLFSQFTSMLDIIEERLEEKGVRRCRLDGSTRDREGQVKQFTSDTSIPVFLISLKAGGFGLNLTQADTVILYDPWWNPAAEDQAAARAHRMGQTLPVHVHKLITADTVEEKILELQASKRDLAGRMLESDEPLSVLSMDDLRGLLFDR